ncbi:hypothetical protein D9M68_651710 [compost metagenome]
MVCTFISEGTIGLPFTSSLSRLLLNQENILDIASAKLVLPAPLSPIMMVIFSSKFIFMELNRLKFDRLNVFRRNFLPDRVSSSILRYFVDSVSFLSTYFPLA